jgi:hypothetical protein
MMSKLKMKVENKWIKKINQKKIKRKDERIKIKIKI